MGSIRQQHLLVSINAGATVDTNVTLDEPAERLTIWVNSGGATVASASFQMQINGANYGNALALTAEAAADVLYRSGGASAENDLVPVLSARDRERKIHPFQLRVRGTNTGPSAITVTIHVVYVAHTG